MTDENLFDGNTTPPPASTRKQRLRDRWLLLSIAGVVAVALAIGGVFLTSFGKTTAEALDSVQRDPNMMPVNEDRPQPAPGDDTPLNVAFMVTHGDIPEEHGDADVVKLMLMHVPADREAAYLVSLPSNYWVDIPGHGNDEIIKSYAEGGAPLTVETMEKLLDVRVDHAALVTLEGMIDVIDTVGGITVENKHATESNGFSYPVGPVSLSGKSATNYVQERDGLPDPEADRAERQQAVLSAVAGKLISKDLLTKPGVLGDAMKILGPSFTVDSELDNDKIVSLGTSMRVTSGDAVTAVMAPEAEGSTDKQAYAELDETKLAELQKALRTGTMDKYAADNA